VGARGSSEDVKGLKALQKKKRRIVKTFERIARGTTHYTSHNL